MTCEHLIALERALIAAGVKENSRGQAWSLNCREWVYFDCFLPLDLIRQKFALDACVEDHTHRGTHDGQESGFYCAVHHDGIMGHHPDSGVGAQRFEPD
ncbi:MAG: hypothetical protein ACREUW_11005 [Burkholderiales bacterium]